MSQFLKEVYLARAMRAIGLLCLFLVSRCGSKSDNATTPTPSTGVPLTAPTDAATDPEATSEEAGGMAEAPPEPANSLSPTFPFLFQNMFQKTCMRCHNPSRLNAGVNLTAYSTIRNGKGPNGESLIVPFKPKESHIYFVISNGIMPPVGSIDPTLPDLVRCWILNGAEESKPDNCLTTLPLPKAAVLP